MAGDGEAGEPNATKLRVVDQQLELSLLPGEELLFVGEPEAGPLGRQLMLSATVVAMLTCFGVAFLPFIWWACRVYANNHRYWVTNNRVIVANKIIGYNVRSIPLERISDIAVRSSFLEQMFGLTSVVVRDMTGEAQAGASMLAVDNAADVQAQLLDYVRQVNRREGGAAKAPGPYRAVEPLDTQLQLMRVLERIEENTRPRQRIATDAEIEAEAVAEQEALEADSDAERSLSS